MIRALIVKELRESSPLIALAGLGTAYALATLWGWPLTSRARAEAFMPFVYDDTLSLLALVGCTFGATIGLKQSAWEDFSATYYFLLHRPTSRSRVFLTKICVGLALVLAMTAALIVLHGMWAAQPGNHATPFFWSMTAEAWRVWFVLPVVYLAAMLSGIRPARWFGTRLLPLVAGGALAFTLGIQPWLWIALCGSAVASTTLVICILHVACVRDY